MTIKIFILFDPVISLIEINPKKIVKKKKKLYTQIYSLHVYL